MALYSDNDLETILLNSKANFSQSFVKNGELVEVGALAQIDFNPTTRQYNLIYRLGNQYATAPQKQKAGGELERLLYARKDYDGVFDNNVWNQVFQ